jgi:hypothetical protein
VRYIVTLRNYETETIEADGANISHGTVAFFNNPSDMADIGARPQPKLVLALAAGEWTRVTVEGATE